MVLSTGYFNYLLTVNSFMFPHTEHVLISGTDQNNVTINTLHFSIMENTINQVFWTKHRQTLAKFLLAGIYLALVLTNAEKLVNPNEWIRDKELIIVGLTLLVILHCMFIVIGDGIGLGLLYIASLPKVIWTAAVNGKAEVLNALKEKEHYTNNDDKPAMRYSKEQTRAFWWIGTVSTTAFMIMVLYCLS